MALARRSTRAGRLPGFGLTLGVTPTYVGLIVLIPLSALVLKASSLGWAAVWEAVTAPRVLAAYRLSITTSFAAALVNAVFGLLIWTSPGHCARGAPHEA